MPVHSKIVAVLGAIHPEHEEKLEWVGEEFDPNAFDLDKVNQQLTELK